jgi:L-ascorbate metabolism protein UlaG (beta-lactamase superfamily)
VFNEVKSTRVEDAHNPAVWYVYNMGVVVKTSQQTFCIDLHHRRAEQFADHLDFAMVTHNHHDHFMEPFAHRMDRELHKCVISNFFSNYGVKDRKKGGYTRARSKTFVFGDVKVITGLCDHNSYLIDYTTTFEIHVGDFTLFHSGDCASASKFNLTRAPDLWVLHPYCGMKPEEASVQVVHPKKVVIGHLQEMCHEKGRARWTYADGLRMKDRLEKAGVASVMPVWGERIN